MTCHHIIHRQCSIRWLSSVCSSSYQEKLWSLAFLQVVLFLHLSLSVLFSVIKLKNFRAIATLGRHTPQKNNVGRGVSKNHILVFRNTRTCLVFPFKTAFTLDAVLPNTFITHDTYLTGFVLCGLFGWRGPTSRSITFYYNLGAAADCGTK